MESREAEVGSYLQLLCNGLSLNVVAICVIIKVPQIMLVFKAKSSRGISLSSVILEEIGYSIMLTYHFAMNYPITTYFEYTFLVFQDLILLLAILYYNDSFSMKVLPFFTLYFFAYTGLAYRFVPDFILTIAISLTTPISASSKLLQIMNLYKKKDAGHVSSVTWAMALYSTIARSITTVIQTRDYAVLVNFVSSALLNLCLLVLVLYYQKTSHKKFY